MNVRILLILVAALSAPLALAADVAGIWKHAEEPGWIEIQMDEGVGSGTVIRNDVYPERVGREILKDLVADKNEGSLWRGQIYAERLGEYKDVEISTDESGRLQMKVKVGFISRTVDWVSVDEVPLAPE